MVVGQGRVRHLAVRRLREAGREGRQVSVSDPWLLSELRGHIHMMSAHGGGRVRGGTPKAISKET